MIATSATSQNWKKTLLCTLKTKYMNLAIFSMIFPPLVVENLQKHSILEILISNLPIL
jgi:hypothetical protein